ncbi:MAG: malic enzyme-like NAD(P)-binding protein [Nitrososphaerales archaeon]
MVRINLEAPVSNYMKRKLDFLDINDTALNASRLMARHKVGSIIVTRKGNPVGIVTERDMLSKVLGEGRDPNRTKLKLVMSSPLITINEKAKVKDGLTLMAENKCRRLCVVDARGQLVGLLSQEFTIIEEVDELLSRALKPAQASMRLHPRYRGKIEVSIKVPLRSFSDFAIWSSPGVAEPAKAIKRKQSLVYDYTNKWNNVAIVTDGSRVLGLGNTGPKAALPVMEGKAIVFKYLGGIDAFPICIKSIEEKEIIEITRGIEPTFGGINLEDIEAPKCFRVLRELRKTLEIPVWHDDQQGTATVTLAAIINALKVVGKKKAQVNIALIGAGAVNIALADLLIKEGYRASNIIMSDSKGIIHEGRKDIKNSPEKFEIAKITNIHHRTGGNREALKDADIMVGFSTPGPGIVKKEWIRSMSSDPMVIACANPVPEIWPWEAKEAGAKVVATGRSDFDNQIANTLAFPGIFRGILDTRARKITDEICIIASKELADIAEEDGLSEDYILPGSAREDVIIREAVAVGLEAQRQRLARRKLSSRQLQTEATQIIDRARSSIVHNIESGIVAPFPEG